MLFGAFCILLTGWDKKKPKPHLIEAHPMRYEDYQVLFGGDIINYHQRKNQ
jgi:hypothetical protein